MGAKALRGVAGVAVTALVLVLMCALFIPSVASAEGSGSEVVPVAEGSGAETAFDPEAVEASPVVEGVEAETAPVAEARGAQYTDENENGVCDRWEERAEAGVGEGVAECPASFATS